MTETQTTDASQLWNRAEAARNANDLQGALECYKALRMLTPNNALVHHRLGEMAMLGGQIAAAVESYRQALALAPSDAMHWIAFVRVLLAAQQATKAAHALSVGRGKGLCGTEVDQLETLVQKALRAKNTPNELNPDFLEMQRKVQQLLQTGAVRKAAETYVEHLLVWPDLAELKERAGDLYIALHEYATAEQLFSAVLKEKPDSKVSALGKAMALAGMGKLNEARSCYAQVLSKQAQNADAWALYGSVLQQMGLNQDAVAAYESALAKDPKHAIARSNLLFTLAYDGTCDPAEYLNRAKAWEYAVTGARNASKNKVKRWTDRRPQNARPMRVGYFSGDYRQHAVAAYVEQLFAHHDRKRVRVFAFATQPVEDGVTHRIKECVDQWFSTSELTHSQLVELAQLQELDIAIDLSGHTAHNRLAAFAHRLAPVQAHYLGYAASTGIASMDYWIADEQLVPAANENQFSERVWKLNRCWTAYSPPERAPEISQLNTSQQIRFGSFNALSKLSRETLRTWSTILHRIPQAILALKTKELEQPEVRLELAARFAEFGISPDRLELSGATPSWAEHMSMYNAIDIALDPVESHTGVTTTCEALWMGVPVITLAGNRVAHRWSSSLLAHGGFADGIVYSKEAYIEKALAWSGNPCRSVQHRAGRREQMRRSMLCDVRGLAAAMEDAYERMVDERQRAVIPS